MPFSNENIVEELKLSNVDFAKLIKTFKSFKDDIELSYPSVPVYYTYQAPQEFSLEECEPIFLDYSQQTWDIFSFNTLQSSYDANKKIRKEIAEIDASNASGIAYILEHPELNQTEFEKIIDEVLWAWVELFGDTTSDYQLAEYQSYLSAFDEFIYQEIKSYIISKHNDSYVELQQDVSELETECKNNGCNTISLDFFESKLKEVESELSVKQNDLLTLNENESCEDDKKVAKAMRTQIHFLKQEIYVKEDLVSVYQEIIYEIEAVTLKVKNLKIELKKHLPDILFEHSVEISELGSRDFESMVYTEGLLALADLNNKDNEKLISHYINDFSVFYFNKNKLDDRNTNIECNDQGLMCQALEARITTQAELRNNLEARLQLQSPLVKQDGALIRLNGPKLEPYMLKSFRMREDLVSSDTHIAIDLRGVQYGQDFFDVLLAMLLCQNKIALPDEINAYIEDVEKGRLEVALCSEKNSPFCAILNNVECVKDNLGNDKIFIESGEQVRRLVPRPNYRKEINTKLVEYLKGSKGLTLSVEQKCHLFDLGIKPILPALMKTARSAIEEVRGLFECNSNYGVKEVLEVTDLYLFINKICKNSCANRTFEYFLNDINSFLQIHLPIKRKSQKILLNVFANNQRLLADIFKVFYVCKNDNKKNLLVSYSDLSFLIGDLLENKKRVSKRTLSSVSSSVGLFFQEGKNTVDSGVDHEHCCVIGSGH